MQPFFNFLPPNWKKAVLDETLTIFFNFSEHVFKENSYHTIQRL